METIRKVSGKPELVKFLTVALQHEWAVSFEYVVHAYSMPKGKYFYHDPVMLSRADMRAQTIQIGIDEMYHALQLGIILTGLGVEPTFRTDEVVRYPRIIDNLKRDKMTEDQVTELYQAAEFAQGRFPLVENMAWNISYDEVRHSRQFREMIDTLERDGQAGAECYRPHPDREGREDLRLLHEICRLENEITHRYLRYVMMFSGHQDLAQRLFKNSINHMRHWDKLSGILVKLGDVIAIENAEAGPDGVEVSRLPMPAEYPGRDRLTALESLLPAERALVEKYEQAASVIPEGDMREQVKLHLALTREHVFTQEKLLENARRIKGLA